jgi:hypothetical protein
LYFVRVQGSQTVATEVTKEEKIKNKQRGDGGKVIGEMSNIWETKAWSIRFKYDELSKRVNDIPKLRRRREARVKVVINGAGIGTIKFKRILNCCAV